MMLYEKKSQEMDMKKWQDIILLIIECKKYLKS